MPMRFLTKLKNYSFKYFILTLLIGIISQTHSKLQAQNSSEPAFERIVNVRFGFAFFHPKDWSKREPINGDGFVFTDSKNPKAFITASGAYFLAGVYPIEIKEGRFKLDQYLKEYYDVKNEEILYDRIAPCDAEDWDKETQTPRLTKAFAREVCFKKGEEITVLLVAIHDDRIITIECRTMEKDFKTYRSIFETAIGSMQILPQPTNSKD